MTQRTDVDHNEMKQLPYIIAVDFDGTLVEDKFPEIGRPNDNLWAWMKEQQNNGAKIILWTCRDGKNLEDAVAYSVMCMGFNFDAVNCNVQETRHLFNNDTRKAYANIYIDDKAISPHLPTFYPTFDPQKQYEPWNGFKVAPRIADSK